MSVACPSVQGMTTAASLSLEARDRARGVVLGMAVGDALGAPFEFNPPIGPDAAVAMFGGGSFGWAPGEWTDDTSMAIPLVRVLADGGRLDNPDALARVVRDWREWALAAPDVGTQTRNVLGRLGPDATEADARAASEAVHDEHGGRSGGNGSLMRTAPVVLAHLDDEFALIAAARRVSELTHWEADAGDACAIWCVAAARAIASGPSTCAVRSTRRCPTPSAPLCGTVASTRPSASNPLGSRTTVGSSRRCRRRGRRSRAVRRSPRPDRAVRCGDDTDTVAAIAGQLAGARWGATAIPAEWRAPLHGWPGLDGDGLEAPVDRILDATDERSRT